MIAMHELHIPPNFITPRAMPQVNKHIVQQKAKFQIFSGWCELLKFNGGNPNNKVKASRPHRYVYLPSLKIKNVSYAQSEGAPPIHKHSSSPKQTDFKIKTLSKAILRPNPTSSHKNTPN